MISHVKRAAARYGKRNPSPDDVLMELCPAYHEEEGDTLLYHHLFERVLGEVRRAGIGNDGVCERCGAPKPARNRFCSRKCGLAAIDQSHRRIASDIVTEILRRAEAGEHIKQIADAVGVSRSTVHKYIKEAA